MTHPRQRAKGCLLGLACGDALGRPVEFMSAAAIDREYGTVTEMLGAGTHNKPPGTITDDTELAVCIARSLVTQEAFDPADIATRFVDWLDSGPFDIGLMTRDALMGIRQGTPWDEAGVAVWEERPEGSNAGNGSLMRCAPHGLAFHDDLNALAEISRLSSQITHTDPRCTYGCAILNCTIAALLQGADEPLTVAMNQVGSEVPDELQAAIDPIPDQVDPAVLQTSGYVVHTLQTGLYHGLTADTAEAAVTAAVNMGEDTDTVGAVTGAVAGARCGADSIPGRWLAALDCEADLRSLATQLVNTSIDA